MRSRESTSKSLQRRARRTSRVERQDNYGRLFQLLVDLRERTTLILDSVVRFTVKTTI
jgi:hypothetical protein